MTDALPVLVLPVALVALWGRWMIVGGRVPRWFLPAGLGVSLAAVLWLFLVSAVEPAPRPGTGEGWVWAPFLNGVTGLVTTALLGALSVVVALARALRRARSVDDDFGTGRGSR